MPPFFLAWYVKLGKGLVAHQIKQDTFVALLLYHLSYFPLWRRRDSNPRPTVPLLYSCCTYLKNIQGAFYVLYLLSYLTRAPGQDSNLRPRHYQCSYILLLAPLNYCGVRDPLTLPSRPQLRWFPLDQDLNLDFHLLVN